MNESIAILAGTAALIGFGHTLCGPDHYLPFIVMGKARGWPLAKTLWITFLCGIGHVAGSVALGLLGATLGMALGKLELFEAWRGNLAAQALIIFGFTYCVWGVHRAIKHKPHTHAHIHEDNVVHTHPHSHTHGHAHPHGADKKALTPWVLFTLFVLGPCEPLIPLIMYPAAEHSLAGMVGHPFRQARPAGALQPRPRRRNHLLFRPRDPVPRALKSRTCPRLLGRAEILKLGL